MINFRNVWGHSTWIVHPVPETSVHQQSAVIKPNVRLAVLQVHECATLNSLLLLTAEKRSAHAEQFNAQKL